MGLKKQPTIANSSTEAEYKAIANTTCELLWIQFLLKKLGIFSPNPPTLWCDNLGVTYLSVNPVLYACTKYVELNDNFMRDLVAAKTLQVSFTSSKNQIADILAKPLATSRFLLLRSKLIICSVPLEARGAITENTSSRKSKECSNDNKIH